MILTVGFYSKCKFWGKYFGAKDHLRIFRVLPIACFCDPVFTSALGNRLFLGFAGPLTVEYVVYYFEHICIMECYWFIDWFIQLVEVRACDWGHVTFLCQWESQLTHEHRTLQEKQELLSLWVGSPPAREWLSGLGKWAPWCLHEVFALCRGRFSRENVLRLGVIVFCLCRWNSARWRDTLRGFTMSLVSVTITIMWLQHDVIAKLYAASHATGA